MKAVRLLLSIAALAVAACAGGGKEVPPDPVPETAQKIGRPYQIAGIWYYPKADVDYDEIGIASWYGRKFHGRPTANGERFDMNRISAAHPTLPLPSVVQVTNLDNGRTLRVRINDRGPFARGRILDLSRRAAQLLGFEKQGTARVRVQYIRPDGTLADRRYARAAKPELVASGEPTGPLFVQVGSFSAFENAQRLRNALGDLGEVAVHSVRFGGETFYRVRIGPYEDVRRAQRVLDRVTDRGFYEARIFTDRLS